MITNVRNLPHLVIHYSTCNLIKSTPWSNQLLCRIKVWSFSALNSTNFRKLNLFTKSLFFSWKIDLRSRWGQQRELNSLWTLPFLCTVSLEIWIKEVNFSKSYCLLNSLYQLYLSDYDIFIIIPIYTYIVLK